MSLIKVGLLSYEKKNQEDSYNFWQQKILWKSELCSFQPTIPKQKKGQNIFIVVFVVLLNSAACRKISQGTLFILSQ